MLDIVYTTFVLVNFDFPMYYNEFQCKCQLILALKFGKIHFLSAKNMNMQVRNGLSRVVTLVYAQSITALKTKREPCGRFPYRIQMDLFPFCGMYYKFTKKQDGKDVTQG